MTAEKTCATTDCRLLPTVERQKGEFPKCAILWLHGLGADGHDFEPIVDEFDFDQLPAIRFVFPHAPMRPVTINGGYAMRAWYDILALEGVRREDEAGLRQSMAQVLALVQREVARGVPAHRIVLAGFSQGCAMTLLAGLRCAQRLAGLAGLSGYLPLATTTAAEANPANRDVPVFMAHGSRDEVVSPERGRSSRDQLQALGYTVEWHEYPMEHSVCIEEVRALQAFLRRVLAG